MKDWLLQQLARLGLGATVEAVSGSDEPICVMLVDDTPINLQILVETLKPTGHKLLVAQDGPTALSIAHKTPPALVLLDVLMPGMDGYEVCRRLKADPQTRSAAIIFCSAVDETDAKVQGLHLGAVDFITKPFEPEEVLARVGTHLAVQQLAASLQTQVAALKHELAIAREHHEDALKNLGWSLLGNSSAIRQVRSAIQTEGEGHKPVLLSGAPSAGEEAVARSIHAASPRRDRPFIPVDCSRLAKGEDATLFEGQSKLKLAQGGTLYLEHLQHLPLEAQMRLFQTFADGATKVRLIAHADPSRPESGETFLPLLDLLAQHRVCLPPLAERRDDILPMATELVRRYARRLGKLVTDIDADAARRMQEHDWPGNLRELEDVVARSVALASGAGPLKINDMFLQHGQQLGSYRLLHKLGAGGFGEVWKAQHQLLARPSAVKLIRPQNARDTSAVERFRREARATALLASPHTVTLYDFGVSETGTFYYVMELLSGMDLAEMLRLEPRLSPARVARFLVHACRSLAEAHASGLVHRDLKPSNLYICRLGLDVDFLKILDFGLARRAQASSEKRLTEEQSVVGTPEYMAPETVAGGKVLEGRTDMYSLGATAWHLLAGRPVFQGATPIETVLMHANETPPDLPADVPANLAHLVMRCLSKNPPDRPSAEELWTELEETSLPQRWTATDARRWWAAIPS
ncbi:MAG TPA: protein kinase [Candidatus Xenobia bacterium]